MPCPFQWLVITDGTTDDAGIRNQVDLLSPSGFCLLGDGDWQPAITEPKGGGVWRDSQLAEGRRPADFKAQNVNESMTLTVSALDQDALIRDTQNLRRLLNKARTYGTTAWQDEPVWIEAQSPGESEMRYAIIWNYSTPNDGDPYEEPFFQRVARAGMSDFSLGLEREPYWRADQPGTGTAVEASALEAYDGRNLGNVGSAGTREPTTADEVYVANKRNVANLTEVRYFNSNVGAWSGNLLGIAFPQQMLPNPVLAGDVIVFGIDTTVADSGPFSSLVFDISTAMTLVTGTQWKYSRTGADPTVNWPNLTVQDNTDQDGAMTGMPFDTLGVGSVHWEQPSDWTVQNPTVAAVALGITGYWVAMDIITVAGADTPPWQDNRDIYSIVWPYLEIAAAGTGGDVPMLMRLRVRNQSDNDASNQPDLYSERVLVGARSMSRGVNFTPYLNAANEQNPAGITVSLFGAATFTANATTPCGVVVQYLNVPAAQSICRWTIANTLSQEYHGTYHIFLRAMQTGGGIGDLDLQVSYQMGSAYNAGSFPRVTFSGGLNVPYLLDIGRLTVTPGLSGDTLDTLTFAVDGLGDGVTDVQIQELILFPVDEWSGDFVGGMPLGFRRSVGAGTYLRVDSLVPKRPVLSTVRRQGTDYVTDFYLSITPGDAILQANSRQRLWVLQSWDEGANFRSNSEVACSVQVVATKRYESMRGDR